MPSSASADPARPATAFAVAISMTVTVSSVTIGSACSKFESSLDRPGPGTAPLDGGESGDSGSAGTRRCDFTAPMTSGCVVETDAFEGTCGTWQPRHASVAIGGAG